MKKQDLQVGDVVFLKHDERVLYTYIGPVTAESKSKTLDYAPSLIGMFAYNIPATKELQFVQLPYEAVQQMI